MRHAIAGLALLLGLWAIWVLESARSGVTLTDLRIDGTPVTRMSDGSGGPPVVIAHGFAGSRQMMLGYGLVLAQAGYTVYSFDFKGHGRHRVPMSGDVNAVTGTTQLLVKQTVKVVDAARDGETPVALLGHSMASDILVRVAQETPGIGPMVLLSAFSQEIDDRHPANLLLITGAWEGGLARFVEEAVQMVSAEAQLEQTVMNGDVRRRGVLAPNVEHVSILQSRKGRAEALTWLNETYDRDVEVPVLQTGWALLGLLGALTALTLPLARVLPDRTVIPPRLPATGFWLAIVIPAIVAPLLAAPFDMHVLPVLVADYLALHLAIYGVLQLVVLYWFAGAPPRPTPLAVAALVLWALAVFGLALDRYGASFVPTPERLWIIAALAVGAVPFMLGDAMLAAGAPVWQRVIARCVFLVSLIGAVLLDFSGLFFLLMIAPVIVLFWLTFGVMGRYVSKRAGAGSAGLALGVVLAWALGVTFPLFQV